MPEVLRIHSYDGIGGLNLDTIPLVNPGKDEVRIKVEAFALNYGDFDLMHNDYVFTLQLPARFGDEAAGVIDAIGPEVTRFKVGDKVSTLPWMNEGYGVNGEFAIVPEYFVTYFPSRLSSLQACSIWVAYLTAYFALIQESGITQKDYLLLTAATSSAALAAREIAAMYGAKTIGTTRAQGNVKFLHDCGYDHVIVTGDSGMSDAINDFTDGQGVRIIYDAVGGRMMHNYSQAVSRNAKIFLYGALDGKPTIIPEIEFTRKAVSIHPYSVYNHIYDKQQKEKGIDFIFRAIENGELNPAIDKSFLLKDYLEAYTYQKQSKNRKGKVVITCNK